MIKEIVKDERGEGGIGFLGLLGIVFIALKLMGYIDWSWGLVLLPLYGGIALFGLIFLVAVLVFGAESFIVTKRKKN